MLKIIDLINCFHSILNFIFQNFFIKIENLHQKFWAFNILNYLSFNYKFEFKF